MDDLAKDCGYSSAIAMELHQHHTKLLLYKRKQINVWGQDYSTSIANALELPQSCAESLK